MNTMLKEGRLELWNQCVRKTEAIASNMVLGYEVHLSRPVFSSVKLVDRTRISKRPLNVEFS